MNKKLVLYISFCIFFSSKVINSADAFTVPTYEKLFCQLDGRCYPINCAFIDLFQKIKELAGSGYYLARCTITNQEECLATINQVFQHIKQKLLDREQKILNALQKKFAIDDAAWEECLEHITFAKEYSNELLNYEQSYVSHNESVPKDVMAMFTDILQKKGINPKAVSVCMSSESASGANEYIAAQVVSEIIPANKWSPEVLYDDISLIDDECANGCDNDTDQTKLPLYARHKIELFPLFLKKEMYEKIALCTHEIEHILQQHAITASVLIFYIKYHTKYSEDEIRSCDLFQHLLTVQEAQAEIFAALRDPEVAKSMMKLRLTDYYPDHLYENHFYTLRYIHRLWRIRARVIRASSYMSIVYDMWSRCINSVKSFVRF